MRFLTVLACAPRAARVHHAQPGLRKGNPSKPSTDPKQRYSEPYSAQTCVPWAARLPDRATVGKVSPECTNHPQPQSTCPTYFPSAQECRQRRTGVATSISRPRLDCAFRGARCRSRGASSRRRPSPSRRCCLREPRLAPPQVALAQSLQIAVR